LLGIKDGDERLVYTSLARVEFHVSWRYLKARYTKIRHGPLHMSLAYKNVANIAMQKRL
jgi:hypothetical protein